MKASTRMDNTKTSTNKTIGFMSKNNRSARPKRAFHVFVHFLPVVLDDESTKEYFSFSRVFSPAVKVVYVKVIPGF